MVDWTELLNPINILDIIIVAILIYRLITIVKGTRAVQLIKGILLLLVLSIISRVQPERRRALEQIGNSSLIPGNKKSRSDEEAERLVKQLMPFLSEASRTHTGALLAIQREVGLNEYVNTGIRINGQLSTQLLGNIFISNTPLHDGAVIIEDNTILATSCYLPLSENKNINKALGTRHRAAIGLSEVSDALVCIVSEETGAMSVAEGGILKYNIGETAMREILLDRLHTEAQKPFWQKLRAEMEGNHDR